MFESVTIENFRGIEKLEVPLSPLTVLVGPNGVGKSSILDAISLGGSTFHESVATLVANRRQGLADAASWVIRYAQAAATVGLRQRDTIVRISLGRNPNYLHATRGADPNGRWEARCEIAVGSPYNVVSSSGVGPVPVTFVDSARPYEPRDTSLKITDIQRRGLKSELEGSLKKLDSRVRGIVMDATSAGSAEPAVDLEGIGSRPLAIAGDGIRFMTQLVVGLLQSQGGTALLEEPETHLHPSGIRALADAIVSRIGAGDQVVLSTHSLELVERLRGRVGEGGPPVEHMSVVRLYREGSALRTREIKGDQIGFVLDEMGEDLR